MIMVPRGPCFPDSDTPFDGEPAEPTDTVDARGEDGEPAAGAAIGWSPGFVVVVSLEGFGRAGATGMTGVVRSVEPGASGDASAAACCVAAGAPGECRGAGASNACGC
jgi:hypothetical protein